MSCAWCVVGLLTVLNQVPAPDAGEEMGRELEKARQAILTREASELTKLADQLSARGEARHAAEVRERLPRSPLPNGPSRFVPLPDIVSPKAAIKLAPGMAQLDEILGRSASDFFQLAKQAAASDPPRYALANTCLRDVLSRQNDHPEARRLLGYVPYQQGWAKPYAIQQIKGGLIDHPTFGWVEADWRVHLDNGELPTPPTRGKVRWLPAPEADQLRAGWDPPWKISTEHFEIQTNVPLAEAIGFGRRLESFHDLFISLMADILGDNIPLVRRFHDPTLVGEPNTKRHVIFYFASKQEFIAYLSPRFGVGFEKSLGFFAPPKSGRGGRTPAYFFRDPKGQLPVEANLYHEVSHQLLFETAGRNAYTSNFGNYWVFEGLGTYFETVEPQPDGSLEVGGIVGRRIQEAIKSLILDEREIPLAQFILLDEGRFTRDDGIYLRYQQAQALTVFLMQWQHGVYREGFFDYIRDAYRGRIKRGSGRTLEDRLGQPYSTIEAQFLAFLSDAKVRDHEPSKSPTTAPKDKPTPTIRTVPQPGLAPATTPRTSIRTVPSAAKPPQGE